VVAAVGEDDEEVEEEEVEGEEDTKASSCVLCFMNMGKAVREADP